MNKKLSPFNIKEILELFPLRLSITDYCNLRCFFCSNEGMSLSQKNQINIDIKKLKYLVMTLYKKGLKNVSITGGDPTMHPQIFEIVHFLNKFNFKNLFFHTNGINLNDRLLKKMSIKFSKIAVSIHSVYFSTWQKITNGTKKQFDRLIHNLEILSKYKNNLVVELKFVPIKGYNDSKRELKRFLDFCNKYGFKFKFLNFEPIQKNHLKLSIPIEQIKKKLINLGCIFEKKENRFRGQKDYLPIEHFWYKNCRGVVIEIGCGLPSVCQHCYKSNEIFITPKLEIKPCHIDNYIIPLSKFIE